VLFSSDGSRLLLVDKTGQLIRSGGRKGEGPGEFSRSSPHAVGPGDSVFVAKRGAVDVFAPNLTYVRTFKLEGPSIALFTVLRNGQIAFTSPSKPGEDFLHSMSRTGTDLQSFGSIAVGVKPNEVCTGCRFRLIAQAPAAAEFYAVPTNEYRIERWSTLGSLLHRVTVVSSWFPRGAIAPAPTGTVPNPSITGIAQGPDGVLWVRGTVANANWKPPVQEPRGKVGGLTVVAPSTSQTDVTGLTTVIDAVDPSSGKVVATIRFDGELVSLLPRGYLYSRGEDANGFVTEKLWRLELRR
jgi:hypothetical protein